MNDNKIWLVHKPTGERICLLKNKGGGWYASAALAPRALDRFCHNAHADSKSSEFTLESEE